MSAARELLRRYLRQRSEFGESELFLDGRSGAELRELLARAPRAAATTAPGPAVRLSELEDRTASATGIVQIGELAELREVALGCPRCRLAETRQQVVFGEGSPTARLVVVGEAPGADEDRSGRPFVGRAGKLLTLLLASVGFPRDEVYICNVLKCRPPGNRNPLPDEVEACSPYLLRQIELIRPQVILACGTFAAQTLLRTGLPIGQLRVGSHSYQGVPLVATYHPAALLRNAGWLRSTWEDLQRLRAILDSADPRAA